MKCPSISQRFVVSDDAQLAAQISCALAQPGSYLPIVDGPRLSRPDPEAEIVRRNNAAARADASLIVLAGLAEESIIAFRTRYPGYNFKIVSDQAEIATINGSTAFSNEPLRWGRDRIGIGLLQALRSRQSIEFDDVASPHCQLSPQTDHLVVCEQGEPLTEVIAANYAYSIGAGLSLIPAVDRAKANLLLEVLYSLLELSGSPTQRLEDVKKELRTLCQDAALEGCRSVTFVSSALPFGFAFPEMPTTHLFTYPDLGIAIVNGFSAEQRGTRGVNIAVLVDPETTPAPEINEAAAALAGKDTFVRVFRGKEADVTSVSDAMEHFPYDFLMFATHCGDASGYLSTYDFQDTEGKQRRLVVEVTPGIGRSDNPDELRVTEYMRFHSLDGVDWDNTEAKAKMDVGTALPDWLELVRNEELKPTKREEIDRVRGSAVLRMHDNNMVVLQQYLAHKGAPIIMANACASWHELASRLIFENARAYVGTLFPVLSVEAHPVALGFLDTHYGKPLPEALWLAQNDAFGESIRRPYVISGVYPQVLRTTLEQHLSYIHSQLAEGAREWTELLSKYELANDSYGTRKARETLAYYSSEAAAARAIDLEMKRR